MLSKFKFDLKGQNKIEFLIYYDRKIFKALRCNKFK